MLYTKQCQTLQGIISRVRAGYVQVSKCHFVRAPSAPTCPLRRGFYSQGSLWGLQSRLSPTLDIGWKQSSKCYMLPCKHRLFDLSRMSLKQDRRVPSADGASEEKSHQSEGCSRPSFSRVAAAWTSLAFPSGCTQTCRPPPSETLVAWGDRTIQLSKRGPQNSQFKHETIVQI